MPLFVVTAKTLINFYFEVSFTLRNVRGGIKPHPLTPPNANGKRTTKKGERFDVVALIVAITL